MDLPSTINTITSISEFKLKEKGSVFLGLAFPVQTEEMAIEKLNEIRKQYYDATHHCSAFNFTDGKFKYSDDGEPNGTAGIRILNAINHFELTDILLVVVRYFGGTKLGIGPLGKAYYECAFNCLNQTTRITKTLHTRIEIEYKYELSSLIHRTITKYSGKIEETSFEITPKIKAIIPQKSVKNFIEEIQSASNSQIKTEFKHDKVYI